MCGNGVIEISGGVKEQCDDGNTDNGDGCSNQCLIEEMYQCTNANANSQTGNYCFSRCGDGESNCSNGDWDCSEECDDGNNFDGDGCSAFTCTVEW